jgi:hypothetical protein
MTLIFPRSLRQAAALLVFLATSGCMAVAAGTSSVGGQPAVKVSSEDYATEYDYRAIRAFTDGRTFPVETVGSAFAGLAPGDLQRRLLPVLRDATPRAWPTFAPAGVDGSEGPYRLVLVFSPANDLRAASVCKGDTRFGGIADASDDKLVVFAVTCRAGVPVSQAVGRTTARTPEDPAVARLFRQLLATVFSDAPILDTLHGYPGGLN